MTTLPRVENITWETVSREFDERGPEVCRAEITSELEKNNPEMLDMAERCARDVGDFDRTMNGFCMFYRLLSAEFRPEVDTPEQGAAECSSNILPRVSALARAIVADRIKRIGSVEFTRQSITALERDNPELLRMGHSFAEAQSDYAGVMQGFALLYACLLAEIAQQRGALH